jgi:hypothetical protein
MGCGSSTAQPIVAEPTPTKPAQEKSATITPKQAEVPITSTASVSIILFVISARGACSNNQLEDKCSVRLL